MLVWRQRRSACPCFIYGLAMLVPFLLVLFLFGIALGHFGAAWCCGSARRGMVHLADSRARSLRSRASSIRSTRSREWMQAVSYCCRRPTSSRACATIVAGGASRAPLCSGAWGWPLLDILLACWFFTRVYRYAVRTGLIARYSAETLS